MCVCVCLRDYFFFSSSTAELGSELTPSPFLHLISHNMARLVGECSTYQAIYKNKLVVVLVLVLVVVLVVALVT